MGSTTWGWLLAIVGTLASVAGVVFSWLAWIQAGRAKDAAQQAAAAARLRNLWHNYFRWSEDARELLRSVRELRFEIAQRTATDLLGDLAHNRGWQSGLNREVPTAEIDEVIRLLTPVNTYLTEKAVFEGKQLTIAKHCQTIFQKLIEISGNFDREVEGL